MHPRPRPSKKGKIALYGVLAVGGVAAAYWLYTKYEANAANTAATTTPADTTPAASTTIGTPSVPAYGSLTTLAQWKAAALQYMTTNLGISGGENTAAKGLTDALSGHCVGPNEFAALNSTLAAIGQPPGTGTLIIKQCTTAPASSASSTTGNAAGSGSTAVAAGTVKKASKRGAAATNRANNAAAAARRRAQDLAAAARRRANNLAAASRPKAPKVPRITPPQVTRATGVR